MKRMTSKLLAAILCVTIAASMLPTVFADHQDLRDVVVRQTQAIMDVDWTLGSRIARANVTGERLTAFHAGGILPTTYFEYSRMRMPLKGVMVEARPGSLEQFQAQADMTKSVHSGIGHISAGDYVGMDMHTFVVDILSRVVPAPEFTVDEALEGKNLVPLLKGADTNASSSLQAIGADRDALKEAYGKLNRGDLLFAWDDTADTATAPRVHVMVVKESTPNGVTVMYPAYSQPVWSFRCDVCGTEDWEGPTSSAAPKHVTANQYYTFTGYTRHADTHPGSGCSGTWAPVSGTTWRTETVSAEQLLGDGENKVPYASVGYLPYTLSVYSTGAQAVEATAISAATPDNIVGGFSAKVSSNYRIVAFDAVLTAQDGSQQHFESIVPSWNAWSWDYSDSALDLALMECRSGRYNLTLKAKTGPGSGQGRKDPYTEVYSLDFELAPPAISLTTDTEHAVQGEDVTVTLTVKKDGITAMKAMIAYDPEFFIFDPVKSAGTGVSYSDDGQGCVTVRYSGEALTQGDVAAHPVFRAVRYGGLPITEGIAPFKLQSLATSQTAGAGDEDLGPDRAEGVGPITLGYNAGIHRDYVPGTDLILVFVRDDSIVLNSAMAMTYDGHVMYEVTQGNYSVDADRYICTFAWLTPDADADLVRHDTAENAVLCPEIVYSKDVNQTGIVDISDVQTIANIYGGRLPLKGNEIKWLMADVDRSGRVDGADRDALMHSLMK